MKFTSTILNRAMDKVNEELDNKMLTMDTLIELHHFCKGIAALQKKVDAEIKDRLGPGGEVTTLTGTMKNIRVSAHWTVKSKAELEKLGYTPDTNSDLFKWVDESTRLNG